MAAQIPGGFEAIRGLNPDDVLGIEFGRPICQPLGLAEEGGRGGREPLRAWREFAAEAYQILLTASALHGSNGWAKLARKEADLLMYGWLAPRGEERDPEVEDDVHWEWVQAALDRWLGYGNVRPTLQFDHEGIGTITLGTAGSLTEQDMYAKGRGFFFDVTCGLFGALAAQMLLVVQNKGGFEFCTECQGYFEPLGRKPRTGERHFCSVECRAKRSKYAARDYRQRKN